MRAQPLPPIPGGVEQIRCYRPSLAETLVKICRHGKESSWALSGVDFAERVRNDEDNGAIFPMDTGAMKQSIAPTFDPRSDQAEDCNLCRESHYGDPCPWDEIALKYAPRGGIYPEVQFGEYLTTAPPEWGWYCPLYPTDEVAL